MPAADSRRRYAVKAPPAPLALALEAIRGSVWFSYVPKEGHDWLAARATLQEIPAGSVMFSPGDPVTHIYCVVSGVFRIYLSTPNGDEITLEEAPAGRWFTHYVPKPQPTYATCCACQEDASVIAIAEADMAEFGERWPGLFRGLYHEFTNRAVMVFGRIEMLSLHNVRVRLAVWLLRTSQARGLKEKGGATWIPNLDSQSKIGASIGSTRQRVNMVFRAWVKKGWIELEKDGCRIRNIAGLMDEGRKSGFDLGAYLAQWQGYNVPAK